MKYCQKCGSEMRTRNFALHLLTLTFKIGIPMAIIGAFTMDFIMSLGVNCIYIIPYLSLVLYPFKLGVVHKCTKLLWGRCKKTEENSKNDNYRNKFNVNNGVTCFYRL